MKKVSLILSFFFLMLGVSLISRPASAQYYGGYGYYFQPNSYNCFSGCGKAAKVAAWTSVGLSAVDAAIGVHMYSKQLELQTNQNIYQIEQMKAQSNYPQTIQAYQNIMRVAPFFEDDPTINPNPVVKPLPKVAPITQKPTETPSTSK